MKKFIKNYLKIAAILGGVIILVLIIVLATSEKAKYELEISNKDAYVTELVERIYALSESDNYNYNNGALNIEMSDVDQSRELRYLADHPLRLFVLVPYLDKISIDITTQEKERTKYTITRTEMFDYFKMNPAEYVKVSDETYLMNDKWRKFSGNYDKEKQKQYLNHFAK